MTAKKKTLIELMLDVGIDPEDFIGNYVVSDTALGNALSFYDDVPKFNYSEETWGLKNHVKSTPVLSLAKNWKRTIITKQQFIDAYNEKKSPVNELSKVECHEIKFNPSALNNGKVILTPPHYSVIEGKDLIARSSESYKVDEFRGAMRFNIEKYIDRLGKKDSLVKELRKIADYANRWADYEEKLQGSK